jgi:hypothetical protein
MIKLSRSSRVSDRRADIEVVHIRGRVYRLQRVPEDVAEYIIIIAPP